MYYLYILYSASANKFYVGYTHNYLRRFNEHNNAEHLTFTSKYRPWTLEAVYQCGETEPEAVKMEKFIKKQKSRKLIEKLIAGIELSGILAQLVKVPHVRD